MRNRIALIISIFLILFFQNCGPSHLSGESAGSFNVIREIQGENMTISPSGGVVMMAKECINAPNPALGDVNVWGVCLWGDPNSDGSKGSGSFNVSEAGTYEIRIYASGSYAGGAWPNMDVRVNGSKIGSAGVVTRDAKDYYTFTVQLSAGNHSVMAVFTNDYYDANNNQDRNLFVDKVWIYKK